MASHHNGKLQEANFLALRAVHPAPLTVLVLSRTLLWLLLLSTHRHLLWECCTRQFGTKGMLNILSPCPDACASVICIVMARMETSGILLFLLQCMFTGTYTNNPIRGALLYSCSSHMLQNSLPSEHAPPKTLQAAASQGQCSWAHVCPWLSPGQSHHEAHTILQDSCTQICHL